MSRRRKTCECCRKRLDLRCEDYWCVECRAGITASYRDTMAQADQWRKEGVSPLEIAVTLLERVTGPFSAEERKSFIDGLMDKTEVRGHG